MISLKKSINMRNVHNDINANERSTMLRRKRQTPNVIRIPAPNDARICIASVILLPVQGLWLWFATLTFTELLEACEIINGLDFVEQLRRRL